MAVRACSVLVALGLLAGARPAEGADAVQVRFEWEGRLIVAERQLPAGTSPVEAAIRQLVAGPTAEEAGAGLTEPGSEPLCSPNTYAGAPASLSKRG